MSFTVILSSESEDQVSSDEDSPGPYHRRGDGDGSQSRQNCHEPLPANYKSIPIPDSITTEDSNKAGRRCVLSCSVIIAFCFIASLVTLAYCIPGMTAVKGEYSEIPKLDHKFDQIANEVRILNNSVADLNGKVGNFTSMEHRVDGLDSELDKIADEVQNVNNSVTNLDDKVGNLTLMEQRAYKLIQDLNRMDKQYNASLEKLNADLESLENTLRNFNATFESEIQKILKLSKNVDALEKENVELKVDIQKNVFDIQRLNASLEKLEERLSPNGASKIHIHVLLLISCVFVVEVCRKRPS